MQSRVTVAVAGTGGIFHGWGGGSGHLPALCHVPEAQAVALCDTNQANLDRAHEALVSSFEEQAQGHQKRGDAERAEQLREDAANVRIYSDVEEMVAASQPQLVDIITPPAFHLPGAIAAVEAGAHVMCEKPMARTWLEARRMAEATQQAGKFFQMAEQMIFEPQWYGCRKLLQAGAIGEPLAMFISFGIGDAKPIRWQAGPSGGGSLIDMGVHAIMTGWFVLGYDWEPVAAKAVEPYGIALRMPQRLSAGTFREVGVEDDAHVLIHFEHPETGARAMLHVEGSWSYRDSAGPPMLIGTNGSIQVGSPLVIIDAFDRRREVAVGGFRDDITEAPLEGFTSYAAEMRGICQCILTDTPPICDERVGAETMAIIDAAYLSEMQGRRTVSLDEFKQYALEFEEREGEQASELMVEEFMAAITMKV